MAVVQQDANALQFASAEMRADMEVVLAAVQQNGTTLEYRDASEEIRGDKEVVLAAVQQFGFALKYASAEMRVDKEVVLALKAFVLAESNKMDFGSTVRMGPGPEFPVGKEIPVLDNFPRF